MEGMEEKEKNGLGKSWINKELKTLNIKINGSYKERKVVG
jgi:hypothetical protein